jgi:predicted transcriptional regulator of viral defense system
MPPSPAWDRLYQTAETQAGLFTLSQAEACGYSSQHLQKHLRAGRIHRIQRGIYRLTQFPAGEHEELVALWLWSGRAGVFSHQTSLFLHDLSDVLPAQAHMTVPTAWRRRRLRVPEGLVLHHGDLDESDRTWVEVVPVTTPRQAIFECILAHVAPELTEQAIGQAKQRGLISSEERRSLANQLRRQRDARS